MSGDASDLKRRVAEGYNRLLDYEHASEHYANTLEALRRFGALREPVLDVACGTGGMLRLLLTKAPGLKAVGVDLAEKAVAKARSLGLSGVLVGDAERLPFPDGAFRTVFFMAAVERTPDPLKALAELRRVTHPEGWVVVTAGNALWVRLLAWKGILTLGLRSYHPMPQPHLHQVTYGRLRDWLREAGFRIEATRRTGRCPTRVLEWLPWDHRFGKHAWFLCRPAAPGGPHPPIRKIRSLPEAASTSPGWSRMAVLRERREGNKRIGALAAALRGAHFRPLPTAIQCLYFLREDDAEARDVPVNYACVARRPAR